jgi:hypothetical protein
MTIQNHQPGIIHNHWLVFINAIECSTLDIESVAYKDYLNNQLHRIVLDKLTATQLVKEFCIFCGFTRAHN